MFARIPGGAVNDVPWDGHNDINVNHRDCAASVDQPAGALLTDLKARGLLDSTLVIWGGEFGRLPIAQLPPDKDERKAGRDHNKNAFCSWMAGGGVKGGTTYGATDELGLHARREFHTINLWEVPAATARRSL
jgi:uncharacterized protein (DUF1501 family)